MKKNKILSSLHLFGTLLLTIFALVNMETTVFYMLYLFWWQALIEIFINIALEYRASKSLFQSIRKSYSSIYVMGMYLVFIVILFGFVFSISNLRLFQINAQVFMFQNLTFNFNIILSLLIAVIRVADNSAEDMSNIGIFSIKMLILHISIILGAFIHFGLKHFYPETFEDSFYPYLFSAIPFLLIRTFFDWKMHSD